MKTIGSRAEVFHGTAKKTSGGLLKKNLKKNKRGRIVSKKMSNRAKKDKRLVKAGYKTKKGKFTLFPRKKKGGMIREENREKIFNSIRELIIKYTNEKITPTSAKKELNNIVNNLVKLTLNSRGDSDAEKLIISLIKENPEIKKNSPMAEKFKKLSTDFINKFFNISRMIEFLIQLYIANEIINEDVDTQLEDIYNNVMKNRIQLGINKAIPRKVEKFIYQIITSHIDVLIKKKVISFNGKSINNKTERILTFLKLYRSFSKKKTGTPPPPTSAATKTKRSSSNWLNADIDLTKLSEIHNVNFVVLQLNTWLPARIYVPSVPTNNTILIKFNGSNHYDFIGVSKSMSFRPEPGYRVIGIDYDTPEYYSLMNSLITTFNGINIDEVALSVAMAYLEDGTLPETVGDGKCGWYAVLIGIDLLKNDYSDIRTSGPKAKLSYNEHKTCRLQETIINSNLPSGGKGKKYKIYTGSRGGKYYKRKGKKIYI